MLTRLVVNQFRNLVAMTINPHPGINIFYGQNGAGKTSILEAIYFLGLGRSFRTHVVPRIIHHDANELLLFAQLQHDNQMNAIGMERSRNGEKKIRFNGNTLLSLALLAKHLPLQLLTTECHQYFHDGPNYRRQFLDWGLFHVEPLFFPTWQQFQKALKQRNSGLKNQLPRTEIEAWDQEIVQLSLLMDKFRKHYLEQLHTCLSPLLNIVLPEIELNLRYSRGWSPEKDLAMVLHANLSRDMQLGYTQFGPQRADLQLYAGTVPAGDHLSQGQQKLAAYGLHLAQGILMQQLTSRSPIYLIDDLPSELDADKRQFVTQILTNLKAQVFITSITPAELSDIIAGEQAQMFHVEHGQIKVPRGT